MDIAIKTRADSCGTHGGFESQAIQFGNRVLHWTKCPECSRITSEKEAEERAKAEAADRQRRLEARLDQAGVPLRYRAKDFASFKASSDAMERAKSTAMAFARDFDSHAKAGTFGVFMGRPGTGKSHLAIAILQEVMKTRTGMYISAIDAIRMIRNTWRRDSERTETQVLQMLASIDLLVLDEIGVQYGTDAEQVTLFDIIDKRYRDLRPTILLTNLNAQGMRDFLGDRSYDRLRENWVRITFDWESQRGLRAA